jgi:serine phosphatase RsbU (regulator of sigma subunit)
MAEDNYKGLREENERLKEAIEELKILNEIATAISSTLSLEDIMGLVIQKCIKHLESEQGAIMVLDPKDKNKPFHTMIRKADRSEIMLPYRLDAQLMGWMLSNKKPLVINDFENDTRFQIQKDDHGIRSVLSAPLLLKGGMIGSVNVFNKNTPEGFTQTDKRLLAIIATESAQVIENARLYAEEQAFLSMQEEMRLAYKIQMGLLPKSAPQVQGYDIAGRSIPAKEVGGDYFDFMEIDGHHLGLCLGDVSGKGMPAALLMANLQATLRSHVLQDLGPCECLKRSNDLIFRSTDADRFASLFYGILNTVDHTLTYCNGGHNYPFLIAGVGEPARLKVGGTVLGTFEQSSYTEDVISLNLGDVLLIYSDGVTEAVSVDDEEFGEARLSRVVSEHRDDPAERLIIRIIEAVQVHAGQTPQEDDITLVVVKRTPEMGM